MKTIIALLALLSFSSCATILQGSPDRIPVNSMPSGASVYLNGVPVGTTPLMLSINHSDDANIMIKKEGYEPVMIEKGKVVQGWFIVDIIWWPGAVIDLITHNQGKYSESAVTTSLVESKVSKK